MSNYWPDNFWAATYWDANYWWSGDAVAPVDGPYYVDTAQTWSAGAVAHQVTAAGAVAFQVRGAGAVAAQTGVP